MTLVAESRRVIEDLLTTLAPGDELLLVPYDRAPHPASARFSADLGRLRAAAQALADGARRPITARALEFAARALAESHALNRELFWISDFQAAGFARSARAALAAPAGPWAQARVYLLPLAPRSRANAALADAALAPAESGLRSPCPPRRSARARRSRGRGARGRRRRRRARPRLPRPARARRDLDAAAARAHAGTGRGGELPDDALALDNRRAFAAGRAGTLRVVLREDGPPSPLRLALEAGSPASGIAIETVDAAALAARLADADVLVLNDVERLGPTELQAVLDF